MIDIFETCGMYFCLSSVSFTDSLKPQPLSLYKSIGAHKSRFLTTTVKCNALSPKIKYEFPTEVEIQRVIENRRRPKTQ